METKTLISLIAIFFIQINILAVEIHVLQSTDVVDYKVLNSNWNNCKIDIETNEASIISLETNVNAKIDRTGDTNLINLTNAIVTIAPSAACDSPVTRCELNTGLASVAEKTFYGDLTAHPVMTHNGSLVSVAGSIQIITNIFTGNGTNYVGTFWDTNSITLIRSGQAIGRFYAKKVGGIPKDVNGFITTCYTTNNGATTNDIHTSALSDNYTEDITSFRLVTENHETIEGTNIYYGVKYFLVQSGGGGNATVLTYLGRPYDTQLATPGTGPVEGYALAGDLTALEGYTTSAINDLNVASNLHEQAIIALNIVSNLHRVAIANLNQTTNYLAPYFGQFSTWSPTINADQYTLPTGLNDIISNDYLYAVNYASPTTTVTFAHPGIYKVYVEVGHAHAGGYTVMVFYLYKGGTASIKTPVMSNRSFLFASGIAAQNSTENGSVTIIVEVSAPGQTLDFKLGGRSHVTDFTKHWFYAGFTVTALQVF